MLISPPVFEPVSVPRLYRVIASQIKAKIERGEFSPGTRLPSERDLADVLQVSRPTLREALIALEIEGYVDVRVWSGVFVANPREDGNWRGDDAAARSNPFGGADVGPFELIEARLLIEPQIAALAAKNGTDEQVLAIQAAAYAMAGAKAPSQNDRSFHEVIAQASGNAALMALVSHLWAIHDNSPIFTRLDEHIATEPVWQQAELEHLGIVDAILSRNPGRAQQAMHAHLTRILDRLHRNLPDDDDDG